VLVDDAGEASGYSVEGLVLKIMANHETKGGFERRA